MNVFKELYQNRKLIWKLSKNDFRNKFAGAYFGIVWAFIQPMVTVAVYFVVFQLGLRVQPAATGYPYICWLVSGIIPWFFFSDALPSASNCLLEYSYLVKKVVFKISVLPIVKVISSLFVHLFFIVFAILIFCTDGKTSAGSDYPDRVLYLCGDLSRRCTFLSDLFHHTVFPRFRPDYQCNSECRHVGNPDSVGYHNNSEYSELAEQPSEAESSVLYCPGIS